MQTNFNFLQIGAQFPPDSELLRIQAYKDNLLMYNGQLDQVFPWYKERLSQSDITQDIFYTQLNYFKLISAKTADLVCGEAPDLSFSEEVAEEEQAEIKACANIINSKLRGSVIDYSRFGETVIRTYADDKGEPKVVVVRPIMMIPVVDDEDNAEVKAYVIAYAETTKLQNNREQTFIYVQIHEPGKYTQRKYTTTKMEYITTRKDDQQIKYYTYTLGALAEDEKTINTGLDSFAVFHIVNEPTSENIHGSSDYEMFSSIVAEIEVRYAQIARILDKHADPAVAAPASCFDLATDQSGEILGIKMGGKAFPLDTPDAKIPQYITWDGQLTAAYQQIAELTKQLDKLTEMGAVISDNDSTTGGTQGFEALQVKMTNARLKARRISEAFDKPYKDIIAALYQIKTRKKLTTPFTVTWNDGLPNDALRDAQIAQTEISMGAKSKATIRKEYYGMTKKQADDEQTQIDKETPANAIEPIFA